MADELRSARVSRNAPIAIDSLSIDAFRGLGQTTLEKLGRINLLVGNNNAGKTSVLEAIAVHLNPVDIWEWFNVVRSREVRTLGAHPDQLSTLEAIRWIFPNRDTDIWGDEESLPISIASTSGSSTNTFSAKCIPFRGIIPPEVIKRTFGLRRRNPDEIHEDTGINIRISGRIEQNYLVPRDIDAEISIWSQLGLSSAMRRSRGPDNVQFLAPYAHRNTPQNLRRLTELTKMGTKADVDALLRALDPQVTGIEIISSDDGRFPRIAVRTTKGGLLPLSVLGDGTRRALSIALGLRTAGDGVLLIDEIEAALHVSALDRVYRWLDEAADSYRVQLFATTHSLEAIDAIVRSRDPNAQAGLSAYALNPDEPGGVKRYTGGMLHRLVHQRGLDIRS